MKAKYRYRVIFMDREIDEVIASQQAMINKENERPRLGLKESYQDILNKIDIWYKNNPGVDFLRISHKSTINEPLETVHKLESFLGVEMNTKAIAQVVDPSLHRRKIK